MSIDHSLQSLPDHELLRRLSGLVHQARRNEAELIAHLAEVDERRLYARSATSSLFAYCTEVLHLSEPEACLRIAVARASKTHPPLLAMLAEGRIHLSGIATLAPHLTVENRDVLLERATHRSKRQIEELVAELSPRADVPDRMRRLPERRQCAPPGPLVRSSAGAGVEPLPREGAGGCVGRSGAGAAAAQGGPTQGGPAPGGLPRLDEVAPPPGPERAARSATVEPIAAGRYKVQFTASAALRDKLERLQALMQSSRADASLAAVIEAAVDEKLRRLEAKRFGRTEKPRKTLTMSDEQPRSRHIPAAIRRAVWNRDEGRCRFVDGEGQRCTARRGLEFHHVLPFALGGDHGLETLRLYCRTHNRYAAEIDYGRRQVRRPMLGRPGPRSASP